MDTQPDLFLQYMFLKSPVDSFVAGHLVWNQLMLGINRKLYGVSSGIWGHVFETVCGLSRSLEIVA